MEKSNKFPIYNNNNLSFNMDNDKEEKEIAKIYFYSMDDEKLLFEGHYPFNNSLSIVIKDFILKQKNEENFTFSFYIKNDDSQEYLINENKLISFYITNLQDTVNLMEFGYGNNSINTTTIGSNKHLKIFVKINQKFNIPENIEEYIINNTQLIGKPAMNQLKYYVYHKIEKTLKTVHLSKRQIDEININFFSRKTSYCNAENKLFIYEGNDADINENNNNINYNSKFISINLKTKEVNLISSNFPQRLLHSMIFIPEKYIFIVGGKKDKEVLIYTINKDNKIYEVYPNLLPYELFEPSLITVDNKYLYAFENSTFCMHILRTNFISESPFEEIEINNYNSIQIDQKFFGLVRQKNNILLLGGQMINSSNKDLNVSKNIIEFNYKSNIIRQSLKININLEIFEKTFIPLGNFEYMQITEVKDKNEYKPKVIIFEGYLQRSHKTNTNNVISSKGNTSNCFVSIHTKNVNIHLRDNVTSLVGTSSYGEMPVPLYNNFKNK
jgi:hypothetical protein